MTLSGFGCRVCDSDALIEIADFPRLPRVTSDCKPYPAGGRLAACSACGAVQKPSDPEWRKEIAGIYRDYTIYFQSSGVEQAVFDASGAFSLRSQVLLDRVNGTRPLAQIGTAIDIGCGKGTFLTAFSKYRPGWRLMGHELNRSTEAALLAIPGFERLFTCALPELPESFDLITLVHALEHFDNPFEGLRDLAPKLGPGGLIVVEVPNGGASPFDLVVADHASHFTRADLARLSQRAGLAPVALADDWMAKELSLVAMPGQVAAFEPTTPDDAPGRLSRRVAWLEATLARARSSRRQGAAFGIFGTSIAAMWLYGVLGSSVAFFVDEDPARIGTLHGRPVIHPDEIPNNSVVFLALLPDIAASVAARIARSGIYLETPPPLK